MRRRCEEEEEEEEHLQEPAGLQHLAVGPVHTRVAVAGVDHLRARLAVETRSAPRKAHHLNILTVLKGIKKV